MSFGARKVVLRSLRPDETQTGQITLLRWISKSLCDNKQIVQICLCNCCSKMLFIFMRRDIIDNVVRKETYLFKHMLLPTIDKGFGLQVLTTLVRARSYITIIQPKLLSICTAVKFAAIFFSISSFFVLTPSKQLCQINVLLNDRSCLFQLLMRNQHHDVFAQSIL